MAAAPAAVPRQPQAATAAPGPSSQAKEDAEISTARLPTAHEAAVLYAAGYMEAAEMSLRALLKTKESPKSAWLMLFDLLEYNGNRPAFDELAHEFTIKFEVSPPLWRGAEATETRRAQPRDKKDNYPLKSAVDGTYAEDIRKMRDFALATGSVRIDLTKVAGMDPKDAIALADALKAIRAKKIPIWLTKPEELIKALRAQIGGEKPPRADFELLLEIYQVTGKAAEHEEVGLEFAIAFEESPPVWEKLETPGGVEEPVAAKVEPVKPTRAGIPLSGVITESGKLEIEGLMATAANMGPQVTIDAERLRRIEFSASRYLFEVLHSLRASGKNIVISGLSEINAAFLEVFGVGRWAVLVRLHK